MRMNQADQERRLQQLRGNAYGTTTQHQHPSPADPVEKPINTIPGLKKAKSKHVNLFEDLENGQVAAKVEGNPAREKELAIEKKKWEDLVTSKLVNATNDHSPWYSQLDKVSGLEKEQSEVEKELKEKKQAKWKDDADPLKQMERFLTKKREVDEREERKKGIMERGMTERERRRGRERTPDYVEQRRKSHRLTEDGRETERRHRHDEKSHSRSSEREHRRHRHRHRPRSRSPDRKIELLRAEREKREAAEKERIARLMKKEGK